MTMTTFDRRELDSSYDPYPIYRKMLNEQRVVLYEKDQDWCFFGFEDCYNLLKHTSLGRVLGWTPISPGDLHSLFAIPASNGIDCYMFMSLS